MDIFTQGLLGASLASSSARKEQIRQAALIGFIAGIIADADIFIMSGQDPLLNIEYHRHFTHSIFFIPLGAFLATVILWPIFRLKLPFKQLYLFSLAGYSLSGFIDACTSYGTHLLWPVYEKSVAFHIISIIDPVFTAIILVALVLSYKNRQRKAVITGLVLCLLYLGFGWFQLERARNISIQMSVDRGHVAERLLVKPTLGNLVLWRSVYEFDGQYYVDAIRVGFQGENRIYPGDSISVFDRNTDLVQVPQSSILDYDIQRFEEFSNHYVAILPDQPEMLADIRYSMLPNSLRPLWGLNMRLEAPQQHATYTILRDASNTNRQKFMNMLLGRDLDE